MSGVQAILPVMSIKLLRRENIGTSGAYGLIYFMLFQSYNSFFWVSWENIGKSDIPAVMTKIIELTGEDKMYYVGHR